MCALESTHKNKGKFEVFYITYITTIDFYYVSVKFALYKKKLACL